MRKADLVSKISEETGVNKVDVLVSLESFFKEVKDALESGENVYIRGFGSFVVKKRAKKLGRNIKKNEVILKYQPTISRPLNLPKYSQSK